jgi:AAA15 family ATPase/GTPase
VTRHISELKIEAFRGIHNLYLEDLGELNILVGDNNCGKTSVLESLLILSNPSDFAHVISVSRIRDGYSRASSRLGPNFFDSFIYLFDPTVEPLKLSISGSIHNLKVSTSLTGETGKMLVDLEDLVKQSPVMRQRIREGYISAEDEIEGFIGELTYYIESVQRSLFELPPKAEAVVFHKYIRRVGLNKTKPIINTRFISTIDHLADNSFRSITKNKSVNHDVIQLLNIFDENITDLRIVQEEEFRFIQTIEHRVLGTLPLSTYGDGIKKVIALANGVVESKDGILLIDEVETSIHKSAMKRVFSWLVKACKSFNVQLFLTTHSLEAVDEILLSDSAVLDQDMARVITLVKKQEKTVARILTGSKAVQVRDDFDLELRS